MDRKSETHSRVRRIAALAVTSLAAITLLIGPDATLGLDVPTAGGVVSGTTQVTQNVSSTVDGTTQQVVTTVETTAQPVVQTTQQATTQVQQTVAPAAAAPKASAPAATPVRTEAPKRTTVTKQVAVRAPALATAGGASQAGRSVSTAATTVTKVAAAPVRTARRDHSARQPGRPATGSPAASTDCDAGTLLGSITPLLTALRQESLLAVACDAANLIASGSGPSAASLPTGTSGGPIGTLAALPARLKLLGMLVSRRAAGVGVHGVSAAADPMNRTASRAARTRSSAASGSPIATVGENASFASTAAAAAAHAAEQGSSRHGGLFGSSVTGTEAVFALLAADWALLVGIVMWKLARRRRFVPSFS